MTELLPFWFVAVVVTVLGLVIGSFLNVVVYRVPEKQSLLTPSACPHCHAPIRWWQNIPVLSWILLRGKCAQCAARISVQYPLIEAGTGLAFFGVLSWLGNPFNTSQPLARFPISFDTGLNDPTAYTVKVLVLLAMLYLAAISIALALIDLRTKKLPNVIVLPSVVVIVLFGTATGLLALDADGFIRMLLGLLIYSGSYFAIAFIYPAGMGMGDVKLALVLGAYLGWQSWSALIVGWFAPFLLGGLYAVVLMILRRGGRKTEIPFGPWMLLGCWIGLVLGEHIMNGYLQILGVGA